MEEIDLKELFELFISKIFQIITIVIIATIIGTVYTFCFTTPKYSSYTTLLLTGAENAGAETQNSITTTDVTLNSKLVSTYSKLVKSKKVLRKVISNLNMDITEADLINNVKVALDDDTELIKITVTNEDAAYSAKIANEIAKVFCETIPEYYFINNINIVDEAEVSDSPSNINHIKDIVIFAFGGLVIAAMYVFIVNMLDTTIKTPEDIENGLGIPVLVSIPLVESFSNDKGGKK